MSGSLEAIQSDPYKEAKLRGLNVIEADEYILQLDFDTQQQAVEFPQRFSQFFHTMWEVHAKINPNILQTISQHGHQHVYIELGDPTPTLERICMQLILGSDPMREHISYLREISDHPSPVVLFETDTEVVRYTMWRHMVRSK